MQAKQLQQKERSLLNFLGFSLRAHHSLVCKHKETNLFSNGVLYLYVRPKSELYFALHEKAS